MVNEALDVTTALFGKLGPLLDASHRAYLTTTLAHLSHKDASIRKRAIAAIAAMAPSLGDADLETCVTTLLSGLDRKSKGTADPRTLIQTIGAVSRQVGFRLGRHLRRIVPLFLDWLGEPEEAEPARDEERENCLQAFESFLLRSPKEVTEFVDPILTRTLAFLQYDPNYIYPDEDGDEDSYVVPAPAPRRRRRRLTRVRRRE